MTRQERIAALKAAARERVLILDGAWGVMIQKLGLDEADYRGDRFGAAPGQLKGDNDLLCVTRPDIVADLHDQYFAAGADISEMPNLVDDVRKRHVFRGAMGSCLDRIRSVIKPTLAQIEMDHINEVLRLTSGNKTRAARILGISRQGLIEKLRRLRIEDSSERTVERT